MEQGRHPVSAAHHPAAERADAAIAGERHAVTFAAFSLADERNSRSLPEYEDAYLVIDDALRRLVEVVYAYEGSIDRFTDDGFMALFGVPVSHENDPERAVQAALDMQRVAETLCRDPLVVRRGLRYHGVVHTSEVLVGNTSADLDITYTTRENIADVLHDLRRTAPPNKIVVSTTTQRHVRSLFDLEAIKPLLSKGADMSNPTFEVRGETRTSQWASGKTKPMVGRRDELQRLHDAWDDTFYGRESRWVFLTGESGIGKTRLVAEFQQALSARARVVRRGVCVSHLRQRSLWAIGTLLRDVLGITAETPAVGQAAALDTYLHRTGLSYEEVAPFLRSVLGLAQPDPVLERRMRFLDPAVLQRQTHAALRQVLLVESALVQSAFVLEDIQWIDPASLAFLQYLLQSQSMGDAPLIFVLVARTGVGIASIPLVGEVREAMPANVVDLALDALAVDEQSLLLAHLLPLVPETDPALRDQITQRAHGNPLYLEQIVQMLVDQGAVCETAHGWALTDAASTVLGDVPDTIHALMLARFDRLPESLRRTLQRAAVCRGSFPLPLLRTLDTQAPTGFDDRMAELEVRHFLVPEQVGQEPGYRFEHPLLQEVIYDTLLRDDRQSLHDQAANAIGLHDWLHGYERDEALAFHYTRGTEPVRAVPFLVAAAEHAAHRYANEVAITQYTQAITLAEQHPVMRAQYFATAGLGLGRARKFVGELAAAAEVLSQTLAFVQSPHDDQHPNVEQAVQTLCELADVRYREGAFDDAIGLLERGRAVLERATDESDAKFQRLLVERLAMIRFRQGRLDEAFALGQEVINNTLDAADDPLTLASLFNTLGGVRWQQGKLHEAIGYVEQSRARYEELGYSFGVATSLMNLGILLYAQGEWKEAAEYFERSEQLRREIGYAIGRANNLLNLALLRLAMGAHDRAGDDLRESRAVSQRMGDEYGMTRAEIGLGHLAIIEGRFGDAATHLSSAEALLGSAGEDETVQVYTLQALVEAHGERLATAFELTDKALSLARETGVTEQEAECWRVLGILHARADQWDAAERALQSSLDVSVAAGDTYQAGLTLLERARLRLRQVHTLIAPTEQHTRDIHDDLEAAIERFVMLGAQFDRDQALAVEAELHTFVLASS